MPVFRQEVPPPEAALEARARPANHRDGRPDSSPDEDLDRVLGDEDGVVHDRAGEPYVAIVLPALVPHPGCVPRA